MYNITLKSKGIDKIVESLGKKIDNVDKALWKGIKTVSPKVLIRLKFNTPVDTGNLRASEKIVYQKSKLRAEIGCDLSKAYYAPFVELGHHTTSGGWVAPQYFLKRTANQMRRIIISDFRKNLVNTLK